MKKLLILVAIMFVCGPVFAEVELPGQLPASGSGSAKIYNDKTIALTDVTPGTTDVYEKIISTRPWGGLVVDYISSHGGTLVIIPLPDTDDESIEGKISDPDTIAAGGGAGRAGYNLIAAPNAMIRFTKTEGGSTSYAYVYVSGTL